MPEFVPISFWINPCEEVMPDQHDTPPQAAPVAESAATETPPATEELLKIGRAHV